MHYYFCVIIVHILLFTITSNESKQFILHNSGIFLFIRWTWSHCQFIQKQILFVIKKCYSTYNILMFKAFCTAFPTILIIWTTRLTQLEKTNSCIVYDTLIHYCSYCAYFFQKKMWNTPLLAWAATFFRPALLCEKRHKAFF